MKRILTVLFLIVACAGSCFAEDFAEQKIENEKSHAGFNFQKAPEQACGKQTISNKGSWFNINIVINGKPVQVDTTAVSDGK